MAAAPRWMQLGWTLVGAAAALPGLSLVSGPGWVWVVGAVLPGLVAGLAVAVTERRSRILRAQLAAVQRTADTRAELVAAVSHDVRTPLAMVKVAADLLAQGDPGPLTVAQTRFLSTISDQADQAVAIAEDLLVQARIDAGRFSTRFAEADLNRVVSETVSGLRPLAERRDQLILTDLPALSPHLVIDERLIRRAIANLATNAMRFTTSGGLVVVRVLDNLDSAVVCVTDDGTGMTPEAREQLFRPFVSGAALADGTGLGLVLTRQIAELHGGKLLVDTRPQRGTTIMMRLPHRDPA